MHRFLACLACLAICACSDSPPPEQSPNQDAAADSEHAPPDTSAPDAPDSDDIASDAPDSDDIASDAPDSDVPDSDASPQPTTVHVSHIREMRGAWIATVSRVNWPSSTVPFAQRTELESILDAVKKAGLNTVFFQVRTEADAFYASDIEPWSRYLSGTQGQDPGYDPLVFAIDACHRLGLELHAWLNPYRARAGNVGTNAPTHVANALPDAVVSYGNYLWLDPGHPEAFAHTLSVIEDLLARYDFDGLHFDDYFYPYPESGLSFDDNATYAAHGGTMSHADWRRDNVNRMVAAVGALARSMRPDVRWGIAPFGIYRPGMPSGVTGLDQYEAIYADPVKWMQEGWIEYVAPQLYWPTTSVGQPYVALLAWWDAVTVQLGTRLFIGNSASSAFDLDEYRAEMDAVRDAFSSSTRGAIWYSVGPIFSNADGLATMLASEYYNHPAATPQLLTVPDTQPPVPSVVVEEGDAVVLSSSDGIRYWAVYRQVADIWEIAHLIPSSVSEFRLPVGTWAVSAIDRSGRESEGLVVEGNGEGEWPEPERTSCVHTYGGEFVHGGCSPSYQCCDGTWLARGACGACVCEEPTGQVGCGM